MQENIFVKIRGQEEVYKVCSIEGDKVYLWPVEFLRDGWSIRKDCLIEKSTGEIVAEFAPDGLLKKMIVAGV